MGGDDRAAGRNLPGAEAAPDFALQLAPLGDESRLRTPYPANPAAAGRRREGSCRARQCAAQRAARFEGKARTPRQGAIASRRIAGRVGRSDGLRGGSRGAAPESRTQLSASRKEMKQLENIDDLRAAI